MKYVYFVVIWHHRLFTPVPLEHLTKVNIVSRVFALNYHRGKKAITNMAFLSAMLRIVYLLKFQFGVNACISPTLFRHNMYRVTYFIPLFTSSLKITYLTLDTHVVDNYHQCLWISGITDQQNVQKNENYVWRLQRQ